ncbi:MAG: GNAT family N-acetyltransferase [Caldimonas sp.]
MTITIRRATIDDAAAFARIMGDPAVLPGLMQVPYADVALWRTRLAEFSAPGRLDLPLVAELQGEVVGMASLHPASPSQRRRHAMKLGIAVAPAAQGQGVGRTLMAALCDYADNWSGTLRIELDVYTDNPGALRLYEKFGFVIEGTHRNYALRNGAYVDSYSMARLHPHPPGIAAAPSQP